MVTAKRKTLESKKLFKDYLDAFAFGTHDGHATAVERAFAPDAVINAVHPFDRLEGPGAFLEALVLPLQRAFDAFHRRDYIVMAGQFGGADWVSATGHFAGLFAHDWLGIRATGKLAFIRVGEFHKMVDGLIVESYIFLDIPEFLISLGRWPLATNPGYDGMIPGPLTHDGISLVEADTEASQRSMTIVADMLKRLNTPDQAWRRYWHPDMYWYGPGAFGSYVGIDSFAGFQVPFEAAFEGWGGEYSQDSPAQHFTHFGEGPYACSGGWPSISGRHVKPYLGFEPTQKFVLMRVCDWWRRDGDLLVENWVFVDVPDLLRQFGYDLFSEIRKD